jgi:GNAT superfamily N-acetyltransferase
VSTSHRPGTYAGSSAPVQIVRRAVDHEHAAWLVRAFYHDQVARYGFADAADLPRSQFAAPEGCFAVVYRDGEPVGCGGWRWHDRASGIAEIKKVYLTPPARGIGAGRMLLSWLERDARSAGALSAILETGVRNTAALALFASQGYQRIASYVPGRPPDINRAFTRPLTREQPAS